MAMMCAGSKGAKKISPQRERMAGVDLLGRSCRGTDQDEIGGRAFFEELLDVGGDLRVFFVVVGGVEADALVFEYLQQLV